MNENDGTANGTPSDDMDFEAMLNDSMGPAKKVAQGDKVEAEIIKVGRDWVFLDLGSRTEGMLPVEELKNEDGEITASQGDVVTVFVIGRKDGGVLCGTKLGAAGAESTDDKSAKLAALKDAFDAGMPVEGTVNESVKGGFAIAVMGERVFCPISQIDNKYCADPAVFVGETLSFEIIKFEEGGRNIVVSRRKILEAEAEEMAEELWKTLDVGQSYEGVVSSIREYGAFVNIGGTDGLLHISEISHERIENPGDVLEVGQKVTVSVKELDPAKRKISLSLKALMADPWEEAAHSLKTNEVYKGRVVRIAAFGAFVELIPGIEGLVHISQLGAGRRVNTPREVVADGDEVEVRILEIDLERRRVSLTMNTEESENNWKEEMGPAPSGSGSMGTLGDLLKDKLK